VDADDVLFASIEDGTITVVSREVEGTSNYRTIEELQTSLDSDIFWRAPPLLPGQHQPHQGSCPLVQIKLHAEKWRTKRSLGSSSKPRPKPKRLRETPEDVTSGVSKLQEGPGFSPAKLKSLAVVFFSRWSDFNSESVLSVVKSLRLCI